MIYIILILIAAISKAFMDNLKDGYSFGKHVFFQSLNKSWVNKYKSDTDLRPRFFGSTTFLVWLTDLWHFSQHIFLMSIFSFLLLPTLNLIETGFTFVLFLILFELFYRKLRKRIKINNIDIAILGFLSFVIGYLGLWFGIYGNGLFVWRVLFFCGLGAFPFLFIKGVYLSIKEAIINCKKKRNEFN